MTESSPCIQNGTEHQFYRILPDGTRIPGNCCQVEGCSWVTAVPKPRKRRARKVVSTSPVQSDGLDSLRSLLF